MLQDSPNKHGVMGSKSVGEPPLLLSASVLSAFQMAVAAAMEDLAHQNKSAHPADSGAAEAPLVCAASSPDCMPLQYLNRLVPCVLGLSKLTTGWLACQILQLVHSVEQRRCALLSCLPALDSWVWLLVRRQARAVPGLMR